MSRIRKYIMNAINAEGYDAIFAMKAEPGTVEVLRFPVVLWVIVREDDDGDFFDWIEGACMSDGEGICLCETFGNFMGYRAVGHDVSEEEKREAYRVFFSKKA